MCAFVCQTYAKYMFVIFITFSFPFCHLKMKFREAHDENKIYMYLSFCLIVYTSVNHDHYYYYYTFVMSTTMFYLLKFILKNDSDYFTNKSTKIYYFYSVLLQSMFACFGYKLLRTTICFPFLLLRWVTRKQSLPKTVTANKLYANLCPRTPRSTAPSPNLPCPRMTPFSGLF